MHIPDKDRALMVALRDHAASCAYEDFRRLPLQFWAAVAFLACEGRGGNPILAAAARDLFQSWLAGNRMPTELHDPWGAFEWSNRTWNMERNRASLAVA